MRSENSLFRSPATAGKWQALLPLAAASLASQADAAIIFTAVGTNVGAGGGAPGQLSNLTLDLPGINDLFFYDGGDGGVTNYVRGLVFAPAPGGTYVNTPRNFQSGTLGAFAFVASTATAGQTIDDPPQTDRGISIVGGWDPTFGTQYGTSFSDKYLMFQFKDTTNGNALRYGWLNLDFDLSAQSFANAFITGYAYEDTGALIEAGAMPAAAGVPEPGSAGASLLLGAMITGAAGVRRRRKAMAA